MGESRCFREASQWKEVQPGLTVPLVSPKIYVLENKIISH